MISLIDPADPRLGAAMGEPLIVTLIQGMAKTIGPGLRRELWLAEDGGNRPAGAVFRGEGGVLATAFGEDAIEETADFLERLGPLPTTADGALARLLPGDWRRSPVLRYQGEMPGETALCAPSAMALTEHNIAAGAVAPSARGELYAELHLRQRRGAAQVLLVPGEDGEPAAGACLLLGRDHAVIGYLACPTEKQGRGYGGAALFAAVRRALQAKKTPLLACEEGLVPFYAHRGFVPAGEVWDRPPDGGSRTATGPG